MNKDTARVKIREVMTRDLVTGSVEDTVREAVTKMREHNVECLPIVDGEGVLCGLMTFRDVMFKALYSPMERLKVVAIMSKEVVTCRPNSTILEVTKTMKKLHLRRIPVVDADNKLVGLVTDFDLSLFGWNPNS